MRTHLLRTVYPSPAIEAVEPDTGNASNDDDYAPSRASAATKSAQTPLITVVKTAADTPGDDNDYDLGGYAGI